MSRTILVWCLLQGLHKLGMWTFWNPQQFATVLGILDNLLSMPYDIMIVSMPMEMICVGSGDNSLHNSLFKIKMSLSHSIAPICGSSEKEIVLQSTLTCRTSLHATVGRPYCNSFLWLFIVFPSISYSSDLAYWSSSCVADWPIICISYSLDCAYWSSYWADDWPITRISYSIDLAYWSFDVYFRWLIYVSFAYWWDWA